MKKDIHDNPFLADKNLFPIGGLMPVNMPAVIKGVGKILQNRMYRTVKPEEYSAEQAANFFTNTSRSVYRDPNSEALLGKYTGQDSIIADYSQAPDGLPIGRILTQEERDGLGVVNPTLAKYAVNDILIPSRSKQGAFEFAYPNQSGNSPHLPYNYNDIDGNRSAHSKQLGTYRQSKGTDESGNYITYEDTWDINPVRGKSSADDPTSIWQKAIRAGKAIGLDKVGDIIPFGRPFEIYGKQYYNEEGKPVDKNSEGGQLNRRKLWDELSLPEQSEMMRVAVRNGITNLKDIKQAYNEFAEGGDIKEELPAIVPFQQKEEVIITPDRIYNQYLNSLPDNQRFTPNDAYDSYLYWKLNGEPSNFEDAYNRGMFHYDNSDNSYHANSIAFEDDGIGYFLKPKTHPTVHMETDWFNKGRVTEEGGWQRPETFQEWKDSKDFRDNYELVDDPDRPNYYMYRPKKKSLGGELRGPLVEAALYGDGGNIYSGTEEPTQQMQIGEDYWQGQANQPTFVESLAEFNRQQEIKKQQQREALREKINTVGRKLAEERMREVSVESNDNLWVDSPLTYKKKNPHLEQRAVEGAKAHAAWEREHPNLTAWGNALGAVPLAVAAVPFGAGVIAAGDAAAATTAEADFRSSLNIGLKP